MSEISFYIHLNYYALTTTDPISELCSLHWGTVDFDSNSMNLTWSMSIATHSAVMPTCPAGTLDNTGSGSPVLSWTCMGIGSELWILTAKGVLGKVNLASYPRVSAVAIRSVSAVNSGSTSSLGSLLLSCVGGSILELVLEVTDAFCAARSITERRMHTIYDHQHRLLPACNELMVMPRLRGSIPTTVGSSPLILLRRSEAFGSEVLVDGKAVFSRSFSCLIFIKFY